MTIAKTGSEVSYAGDGVSTAFSFPFRFFDDTDLEVYLVDSGSVSTLQTLTTDYSVTNTGTEDGGTVTMVVPPASGNTLLIRRMIPATQSVDYQNNDAFPAETHEQAIDRLTLLSQQRDNENNLAIRFPTGDTASPVLPVVADRANRILTFDSDGEFLLEDNTLGIAATYNTRAEFVTAVAGGLAVANGGVIAAAGKFYLADSTSTDISDLPGFKVLGNFFSASQFPSNSEAYDFAEANGLMAETDEPNRFRGSKLTSGFNNTQNDAFVSYAVQVNSSNATRVRYKYVRGANSGTAADPGTGKWATNLARTVLYFNDTDNDGDDRSKDLKNLKEGMRVKLTDTADTTASAIFILNADAVDNGTYVALPDVRVEERGAGGFPLQASVCNLTSEGTQKDIGLAVHINMDDPLASGDMTAGFFRAVSNVNADHQNEGVRATAIGNYGSAVLRGPEADGTRITTGEVWGSYASAGFNQDNGVDLIGNSYDRANNATSGDPGSGNWGTRSDKTSLRISYTDGAGGDLTSALQAVGSGYKLSFRKKSNTSNRIAWTIGAAGTDNGTYIQFDGLAAPDESGNGTLIGDETEIIIYNGNTATDGKLVGIEIKAANWGGSLYDPLTASGENVGKYNIDFVAGGDADYSFQQPVTAMMHNGNETVAGWLYGALLRNVSYDFLHFYQPLGANVRALNLSKEKSNFGSWAEEVIVIPDGKGIGWRKSDGTTIELGIKKTDDVVDITADKVTLRGSDIEHTLLEYGEITGTPAEVRATFEAAMNSGDPVLVPPGEYTIDGPITTTSGNSPKLYARPAGSATVKLQDNAAGNKGVFKIKNPAAGGYIDGVNIDGNRLNQGDELFSDAIADAGLWINGSEPFDVRNVDISNTTAHCIRALNNYGNIDNITGSNAGYNPFFVGPGGGAPVSGKRVRMSNIRFDWSGNDPFIGGGTAQGGSGNTITIRAANSFNAATAVSSNQINMTAHGYVTNDMVRYMADGGTVIGGLTDDTAYWVIRVDDDNIQLTTRPDGAALTITAGVGTQRIFENVEEDFTIIAFGAGEETFDAAADVSGETITITGHGFNDGDRVAYYAKGNTAISGLTEHNPQYSDDPNDIPVYFVSVTDANNIRLRTEGPLGPFVSLTAGSGTHALMELQESAERVTSFDKSTLVATVSGQWDRATLTVASDTRYRIRQGVTDRSIIFVGESSSDPDADTVEYLTLENIETTHEKLYPSGFAAHVETKNTKKVVGSNLNLVGGGNVITIAQETKGVHLTGVNIETWGGLYGFELADQTDDLVISGVVDGHWGLDVGVQLNGGSSMDTLNGMVVKRARANAVRINPGERADTTVSSYNSSTRTVTLADAGEVYPDYFLYIKRTIGGTVEAQRIVASDQSTEEVTVLDDWVGADPVSGDEAWVQPITDGVAVNGCHLESLESVVTCLFSKNITISGGTFTSYDPAAALRWSDCTDVTMTGTIIDAPHASFLNRLATVDGLVEFANSSFRGLINPALNNIDRYLRKIGSIVIGDNVRFEGNSNGPEWSDYKNDVLHTEGTGTPESSITAGVGSTYKRTDGGAGTTFYVKESGTGNTGWVGK